MEDLIKKFVNLANEYADVAIILGYPNGLNYFRKTKIYCPEERIYVYLADDNRTKSVYFGYIEIILYSGMINFPYEYDLEKLSDIYHDAEEFLIDFKKNNFYEAKKKMLKLKEERIKLLENELEQLKQMEL